MGQREEETMRRFMEEVTNQGRFDLISELCHPDFVDHNPPPGASPTVEGIVDSLRVFKAAFPDLRATIEGMFSNDDHATAWGRMMGTQATEFMGMPSSGKSFDIAYIDVVRFVDGRAIEHWGLVDDSSMAAQLGWSPQPEGS